jgi:hypothetical protein
MDFFIGWCNTDWGAHTTKDEQIRVAITEQRPPKEQHTLK